MVERPFLRTRFAEAVKRKLAGLSIGRVCAAFPALNKAMLSRAMNPEKELTPDTVLVICDALRLRPLSFLAKGVKRAPPPRRKAVFNQTVTPCDKRETQEALP